MWYDVFIVCILLFFTMRGAAKGVVWQLAHIAGIVICFAFADAISAAAGPYVHLEPPLNHWVIMVGAYLACTFVCFAVAGGMTSWIEKNRMKEFDKHLGGLLGLLKGAILATILTFAVVTVSQDARAALRDSHSGRIMALAMDRLHPVIPEQLHEKIKDYIHLLDHPDLDLHAHRSDGQGTSSSDTTLGDPAPLPGANSGSVGFLGQVRSLLGDDVQRVVADALARNSDPRAQQSLQQNLLAVLNSVSSADRAALQQQILQSGASQLDSYLAWRAQQPSGPAPAQPVAPNTGSPTPDAAARRAQLVQEIAARYAANPAQRGAIELQIGKDLQGLPEAVTLAVLEDWRADIYAVLPDPDPATHSGSLLETRMLRQVQRHGVLVESLPAGVQQRLRSVQAQNPPSGNPL